MVRSLMKQWSMRPFRLNHVLHGVTEKSFTRLGFRWEERRLGEQRIGMWMIPIRRPLPPLAVRKRVVFLPGFGDTPLSWLGVLVAAIPFLRKTHDEVVLVDFPGFGGFLQGDPVFSSMDALMRATSDLLDELRPHVLIGHSLGGWIASYYSWACGTGLRPTRSAGKYTGPKVLIPICPAGVDGEPHEREAFEQIFAKASVVGFSVLRPHVFGKEPAWFKLVAHEFQSFILRADVVQFIQNVPTEYSLESRIGEIQADIRLIWGENDTLVPTAWAKIWQAKAKPGIRTFVIPGAGHSPHLERPVVTTAALVAALGFDATGRALRSAWAQVREEA